MPTADPKSAPQLSVPAYDYALFGEVEERPLDSIQQIIGRQTTASWRTVPHVTHHDEADVTDLDELRQQRATTAGSDAPPPTVLAFVIKACIAALKEFPDVNSSLDSSGQNLFVKRYYNIGVAVDTPAGLIVPVLKNADTLSLPEIAAATAGLAEKAHSGKLSLADVEGGTFTVTSLGKIGGTAFTPIINAPEVAIMGVSRARRKPVDHNGDIALRRILPLSLSYDHRVIDGAKAARFMGFIRDRLQDPATLV